MFESLLLFCKCSVKNQEVHTWKNLSKYIVLLEGNKLMYILYHPNTENFSWDLFLYCLFNILSSTLKLDMADLSIRFSFSHWRRQHVKELIPYKRLHSNMIHKLLKQIQWICHNVYNLYMFSMTSLMIYIMLRIVQI